MALSHNGEVRFVLLHVLCSLGLTCSFLLCLHLISAIAIANGLGECFFCLVQLPLFKWEVASHLANVHILNLTPNTFDEIRSILDGLFSPDFCWPRCSPLFDVALLGLKRLRRLR